MALVRVEGQAEGNALRAVFTRAALVQQGSLPIREAQVRPSCCSAAFACVLEGWSASQRCPFWCES